jgi:DNA-binding IclR family transcriptional regulator
LTQPQHGADLIAKLGVSRQHVHQSVVRLAALGLIRTGEADRPIYAVARSDDPSILLRASEETVLSVFPETAATTVANIARACHRTSEETASVMRVLSDYGLVEPAGHSRRGEVYHLTPAGQAHWQRRPVAQTADLPALPVKSDRVRLVLSQLAQHGPARTHSVGQALGIPRLSINALMQYLKRKGLVCKTSMDLHAPHELTNEGKETLQSMLT